MQKIVFSVLALQTVTAFVLVSAIWAQDSLSSVTAGKANPGSVSVKEQQEQAPASQAPTVVKGLTEEDPNKPELPGVRTQLITEDTKFPKRKNEQYESWGTPELTPGMHSDISVLGKSEQDGVVRELVHVQWRELDPIDLWVMRPAGVKKPPVIIYLYSYPSSIERYKDLTFCRFLTQHGFAAVGFTSAVTGQRLHDRPKKHWFVSQLGEALSTTAHDVQMILNYLTERGDFDMTRVGMWGDGSGASVAILAAAVDPRIKALDLLNPWGDWPEWLAKSSLIPEQQRANYVDPEFLKLVDNLDPLKWLPKLKTSAVRLQYVQNGLTVTPSSVRERMAAAAPKQATIVHYESSEKFAKDVALQGKAFDWIQQQFQHKNGAGENERQAMTKVDSKTTASDQ